jgi:hypothetical protein
VGSDVYRTWLADASDLIVPGGTRPLPHDPGKEPYPLNHKPVTQKLSFRL